MLLTQPVSLENAYVRLEPLSADHEADLAAAAVGVLVPLMLKRMRIDPALSAGVILTTFTDCIGFATLLGLGALFLT